MMKNKYSVIIMMIALFGGQTALAQEKIVPETPPVPQDRLDTLYYNKSWKVTLTRLSPTIIAWHSIRLILRQPRSSAPTI